MTTTIRISALRAGAALLALALGAGCATTQVTPTMQYTGALPRPQRILVYRFASNPEEVQLDNSPTVMASWRAAGTTASSEQRQVATSVADAVADNLVTEIQALGMPAQRAAGPPPEDGIPTLAITGQFMAIDEGSRALRMTIGLGAGQSSVMTNVQVFNVFQAGRRMVDAFEVTAQERPQAGRRRDDGRGSRGRNAGHRGRRDGRQRRRVRGLRRQRGRRRQAHREEGRFDALELLRAAGLDGTLSARGEDAWCGADHSAAFLGRAEFKASDTSVC